MNAIAVGKFDALHRGHQRLVEAAAQLGPAMLVRIAGMAEALGWEPRLPLVAEEDRPAILASWHAEEATVPFAEIRGFAPATFVAFLQERFSARALVVGADFRGGPRRAYAAEDFAQAARQAGMASAIVPLLDDDGVVSSSRIRQLLADGLVERAAALLGRPHRVAGIVERGDGRGRRIGVPTANLTAWQTAIPGPGVYAAWAFLGNRWISAVVNVGRQPTIGADRPPLVEAHLIDWTGDAYEQRLALDLTVRLRDEMKFPSLDALVGQLHADIDRARLLLTTPESLPR